MFLYGTSAALVFGPLFFPNQDPVVAAMLSFSTFAASFVARPVGAVVFGHFGDRVGRKVTLMTTMLLMGIATFAVGLLPTYSVIGVAAPALLVLLRFLQGFAFGGEYGGATLIITEYAPPDKRGFYTGINNVGPAFGFVGSAGVFIVVSTSMSEAAFLDWGWRIPFLLSFVLVVTGLFLRFRISESPIFKAALDQETHFKVPAAALIRHYPKELLLTAGSTILTFGAFQIFSVFTLAYGARVLGVPSNTMLFALIIATVGQAWSTLWFSKRSDTVGRKKVIMGGMVLTALWAYPMLWLLDTANFVAITAAVTVLMLIYGMLFGPLGVYLGEMFGTRVRFTGIAVSYNIGSILGGALAPIIATYIVAEARASWPLGLYIVGMAAISLFCALALPETRRADLTADRTAAASDDAATVPDTIR
ncbi:MHS family MFS transporter [Mycobacterium sp. 21AC1]|uniref:MFS transporter n=1 Tax=[Mycobacterium] appelbergii TaxID=2939269 RepID=UPI0029390D9E|nr:MFS transporter [Mycobacterium sp. 21AC1]MDV3128450.1 MHS family MFS transporter [Mycobacterium sp. 21AC1]